MYKDFFGLNSKPFELLPNPRFLYLSKGHKKALSYLRYSIQDRVGFTLLTGDVGSGKTTLLRNTIKEVNASTPLAIISNTRVDALQLLAMINDDFGLNSTGKDKVALLRDLNDFLVAQFEVNRLPILIIDEAQNLSSETLEEVRLLSNLEADSFKLLQIILVGQPELKDLIAQPCLRQLRQRIGLATHLGPLSCQEVEEYIFHRLELAGNRDGISFEEGVFDLIYGFSAGIPRLTNVICDFLLLSAFVDETKHISMDLVREAIVELTLEPTSTTELKPQGQHARSFEITHSQWDERLVRLENEQACFNSFQTEHAAFQERLSSHGRLLEYLINIHQSQFREVGERLKTITSKVEKLFPSPAGGIVNFEARKKG